MRLQELTIYSQYFRFLLEDNKAIIENTPSPYGPVISSVTYDNERQTVACTCSNDAPCEHKVFVHEMIDKERDDTLFRFLEDCREKSAQTITRGTINRLRGAFAREYNLAKGVVQYPERRPPLGWQGDVPRSRYPMRVIQRTPASFMVYEVGSDDWKLVVGISDPECQGDCRKEGCKHEQAVALAVRAWREKGLLPKSQISGKKADTVIMDDLTMVEKAEPVYRTGKMEGRWITIPPGYDGNWNVGLDLSARDEVRKAWVSAIWNTANERVGEDPWWSLVEQVSSSQNTSAADVTVDSAKFEEDMKKAKKLLEKKEKPTPDKPAKPRTRFTDLEL